MAYNDKAEAIFESASNIADRINESITPVAEGNKDINDEGITDALVDAWKELEESANKVVEETELAWAIKEDEAEEQQESAA